MWYHYQKATGDFLLWGIGTGLLGTGTNRLLHVGTGTIVCGTGTTASANASRNPYKKCALNSKKPAQAQKHENDQRHLFLHKMRVGYELRVLKIRYKCCPFMYSIE